MSILVDSSVWISFFRGDPEADSLNNLIDENMICTNDMILFELLPALKIQKKTRLISLLNVIENFPIDIHWEALIKLQTTCLRNGANGIPLADLILVQHAQQHQLRIWSFDKHFKIMAAHINVPLLSI